MRQSAPRQEKLAERIEGLTIVILIYSPLFLENFILQVMSKPLFLQWETALTWLLFSLHENGQKIKPAAVFFTERTQSAAANVKAARPSRAPGVV